MGQLKAALQAVASEEVANPTEGIYGQLGRTLHFRSLLSHLLGFPRRGGQCGTRHALVSLVSCLGLSLPILYTVSRDQPHYIIFVAATCHGPLCNNCQAGSICAEYVPALEEAKQDYPRNCPTSGLSAMVRCEDMLNAILQMARHLFLTEASPGDLGSKAAEYRFSKYVAVLLTPPKPVCSARRRLRTSVLKTAVLSSPRTRKISTT